MPGLAPLSCPHLPSIPVCPPPPHTHSSACHRYPDVQLSFELSSGAEVLAGEQVTCVVALEREQDGTEQPAVHAPRFPGRKDEGWWLVVGDSRANTLLAIKRVNLGKAAKVGAGLVGAGLGGGGHPCLRVGTV